MSMPDEISLDVRGLMPPEPLERVLDALSTMKKGQKLRMLIDREPLPLYRILQNNGYAYEAQQLPNHMFEILIREKI
jgi:uncharacterized protein (DUF2249 family)